MIKNKLKKIAKKIKKRINKANQVNKTMKIR